MVHQQLPCLNSHSTRIPILIACPILCLVLPYHCPIHAPYPSISDLSVCCSCKLGCMLFFELFDSLDEINQNSFTTPNSHPQSHSACEITPYWALNNPIIPRVSKFHPNLSYIHSFGSPPTSQAEGL